MLSLKKLVKDTKGIFSLPKKVTYFGKNKFGVPYFQPIGFNSTIISVNKIIEVDKSKTKIEERFNGLPMVRRNNFIIKKLFGKYYYIDYGWPIAIKKIDLSWKDKFDTPRYEFPPMFVINFFNLQYINYWISPDDDNNNYYEMILWYLYYADKNINKAESTWPWRDGKTKETTWNNNLIIENNMIPKKFTDLIGTEVEISGPIFSYKKEFDEPTKFNVLNVRRGSATIMDMNSMEEKYATVELLLKREGMKKAQWSKPFPDTETKIIEDE